MRWRRYILVSGIAAGLWLAADAAGLAAPAATVQVAGEISTHSVRTEESPLANVVADAVRAADKSDIAFVPASAFADATIPKGNAKSEDILKALEYQDDTVVVVNLTGAQIRRALEHALSLYPQKNSAFLQVSGLAVNIDPNADRDKRVLAVKVGKNNLDPAKTYTVAMPSPLANGALGYFKIWGKADIDHDTNKSMESVVTAYLTNNKAPLGVKSEDRLAYKK